MGRVSRRRSTSGGSYSEMKQLQPQQCFTGTNARTTHAKDGPQAAAAKELLHIVLSLVHPTTGKSFLHCLEQTSSPSQVNMAHALIQRASLVQDFDPADCDKTLLQALLQQTDVESGYTPLHWAIKNANLSAVLLFLRCAEKRLTKRPMELLTDFSTRDKEGLTPSQLLAMMQQASLRACRQDLVVKGSMSTNVHRASRHAARLVLNAGDDDDDDEQQQQDELAFLNANLHSLQPLQQDVSADPAPKPTVQSACEVVTFGRAHHVALGVDSSDATHPRRVREFGLDLRNVQGNATVVAAAAHHSLVVTSDGRLYSCGLGKGGRLGHGTEQTSLIFHRVPLKHHRVVHAAAAENHSLCVTTDGRVYAFGSNRFGQLLGTSRNENNQCFVPRRVEDLRNVRVVQVAAGEKHSMALSSDGRVYTWGDNEKGQLGVRRSTGGVQLVTALCQASPPKVATVICASEHSSLVITKPTATGLPVNAVYQWGHGNPVPIKVNFPESARVANPIDIACAKYHNAAVTKEGLVYTWGLHAEPLGNARSSTQQCSMVIASPQLVAGMLPENGGGIAIAVSAAEHHTAVVTDCGQLYTWGATFGKNVLGHEGVRWQPSPKRVQGVHRAVAVAAAKEHNVVLMGTSFPEKAPTCTPLSSLEEMAAQQVANHVDLFNVIPILVTAERVECTVLKEFCYEFIRLNLDGVLCLGRRSEMDRYLNEQLAAGFGKIERDAECHPLIYDVIMAGATSSMQEIDPAAWMHSCKSLLEQLPVSTLVKYRPSVFNRFDGGISRMASRRTRSLSFHDDSEEPRKDECSERCLMLTADMDVATCDAARSKVETISKEVRSVKKLLNQIAKLQMAESLTPDQHQKVQRKGLLQTDLGVLEPALVHMEEKLRALKLKQEASLRWSIDSNKDEDATKECEAPGEDSAAMKMFDLSEDETVKVNVQVFRCEMCSVTCPDANSLAMHTNGRKHRNRIIQAKEEEEKKVADSILEEKHRHLLLSDSDRSSATSVVVKNKSPWNKPAPTYVQPRYRLPPPPHFPSLQEAASKVPPAKSTRKKSLTGSAKAMQKTTQLNRISAEPHLVDRFKSRTLSHLSPGHAPALVSPPWAPPVAEVPVANAPELSLSSRVSATHEEKKPTYSLGDFLYSPSPPVESPVSAPWYSKEAVASMAPISAGKSLREIQQEEQENRDKEHTRVEGKWYIDQRLRAGSISAIQEAEEKEREQRLFLEEQKQIEAQIERDRQQAQRKARRGKARNDKQKAGDMGTGKGKSSANGGQDRKRRPNNRKKNHAKDQTF